MQPSPLTKRYYVSNALGTLVLIGVLGVGAYLLYASRPCAAPVTYRIEAIDPRFGVSLDTVKKDAAQGAALWNAAAGRTVLSYSDTGTVPISLMYDARQAQAKVAQSLGSQKQKDAALRVSLDAATATYKEHAATYKAARAEYTAQAADYDMRVRSINRMGGAQGDALISLNNEKAQLQQQQAALNAQADALNVESDKIQSQADAYNAQVTKTNAAASAYNQSAGQDFNEGEYEQKASGARISIYEFENNVQLMRVLAHELGHAIGLEHNDNPESIMYPYNTSESTALSTEDTAALTARCTFSLASVKALLIPS